MILNAHPIASTNNPQGIASPTESLHATIQSLFLHLITRPATCCYQPAAKPATKEGRRTLSGFHYKHTGGANRFARLAVV